GSSTSMAEPLGVGVSNYLVDRDSKGATRPLPEEKYYIPGSVLHMKVNNTVPLAYGMPERANVMFDNSPVFRVHADSTARRVSSIAWFAGPDVMKSGWAWGGHYLDGGRAVVDATLGSGKVVLFGPEVAFRGQAHDTYKLLFNSLFYGHAVPRSIGTARTADRGSSHDDGANRSSTGG
ncbi:MAG TPA: hypothetical protein VIQ74_17760, partial [Gemmatimonadaceae bacterium]